MGQEPTYASIAGVNFETRLSGLSSDNRCAEISFISPLRSPLWFRGCGGRFHCGLPPLPGMLPADRVSLQGLSPIDEIHTHFGYAKCRSSLGH